MSFILKICHLFFFGGYASACVENYFFVFSQQLVSELRFQLREERRVRKIIIKGGRIKGEIRKKRLKSNNFTNVATHYNDLKRFEDGVDEKVNICETLDEWRICWIK